MILRRLFWDEHRCVVEVDLSQISAQAGHPHPFQMNHSSPHVSLAKSSSDQWQDLGFWTLKLAQCHDWIPTSDLSVWYSPKMNAYYTSLNWLARAERCVDIIPDNGIDPNPVVFATQ